MRFPGSLVALAGGLVLLAFAGTSSAQVQLSLGNPYSGRGLILGSGGPGSFYITPDYGSAGYGYYGTTIYGPYTTYGSSPYIYPPDYSDYYGYYNTPSADANTRYYSSGYSGYSNQATAPQTTPGYDYARPNYYGPAGYGEIGWPYPGYTTYGGNTRTYVPYPSYYYWRR